MRKSEKGLTVQASMKLSNRQYKRFLYFNRSNRNKAVRGFAEMLKKEMEDKNHEQ